LCTICGTATDKALTYRLATGKADLGIRPCSQRCSVKAVIKLSEHGNGGTVTLEYPPDLYFQTICLGFQRLAAKSLAA
jgi:hypothetical protein